MEIVWISGVNVHNCNTNENYGGGWNSGFIFRNKILQSNKLKMQQNGIFYHLNLVIEISAIDISYDISVKSMIWWRECFMLKTNNSDSY